MSCGGGVSAGHHRVGGGQADGRSSTGRREAPGGVVHQVRDWSLQPTSSSVMDMDDLVSCLPANCLVSIPSGIRSWTFCRCSSSPSEPSGVNPACSCSGRPGREAVRGISPIRLYVHATWLDIVSAYAEGTRQMSRNEPSLRATSYE